MLRLLFLTLPLLFGQPATSSAWSAAIDPDQPNATSVHWTITLSATYCGGYAIGDGLFIQPEAPLSLPDPVPPEAVLFAGQAADVSLQNGILRVAPSPLLAQSMVCMQGDRPFTIELLPSLGMTNPDAGTYTVDVWKSSTGGPVQLPIVVGASP